MIQWSRTDLRCGGGGEEEEELAVESGGKVMLLRLLSTLPLRSPQQHGRGALRRGVMADKNNTAAGSD